MIKDLIDGNSAEGIYIVKSSKKGITINRRPYLTIVLGDASGNIEAKKWEPKEIDDDIFIAGNIVSLSGEVVLFKDKPQIKITNARLVDKKSANLYLLLPSSSFEENYLKEKINYFISLIENINLKSIVSSLINEYFDDFITFPAAKSNHHDYVRGLAEHTISMCEIAEFMAKHYPSINKDYLISGCLLHDLGKVKELSGNIATDYTLEGDLLGHIFIGASLVKEKAKELNIEGEEVIILEHLILSHHGKLEYGSPITPLTREALLLSQIDDIDAKMKVLDKAFDDVKEGEMSDRIFALDNKSFYKI